MNRATRLARVLGFSVGNGIYEDSPSSAERGCKCFGVQPNMLVIQYLNWTFRSSFLSVFFSAAVAFFSLTLLFSILIYLSGLNQPDCINVNGVAFGENSTNFMDAYALSWTTFSTVVSLRNVLNPQISNMKDPKFSHSLYFFLSGLRISSPYKGK